jgi:Na+-transporting NADH:ubiquinone oxidoreductase subunit C
VNKQSPSYVLGFITIICVVFGMGVSVVHNVTQGKLRANEELLRNRVICRAFMLEVEGESPEDYADAVEEHIEVSEVQDGPTTRTVYRRAEPGREALGFVVSGIGFWDRITGILVMTPDLANVVNIQFVSHKETPGLGARIEERWFTDQFKGLKVNWGEGVTDRLIVGPSPDPNAENRVDAITGATQTSMALMKFLNSELERIRGLDLKSEIVNRESEIPRG